MRLVLDASVAIKWYAPESHTLEALEIFDAAQRGKIDLIAPDILLSEFGHALRKAVRVGLPQDHARSLLRALRRSVALVPSVDLAAEALDLAMITGGTFYDALYIALAKREGQQVVTADARMIKAFDSVARCVHVKDFKF